MPSRMTVDASEALILFQTKDVLLRPFCILEVNGAIVAQVPIVALNVAGKGYNFEDMAQYLTHLDTELERRNPGAAAVLREYGLDPVDAA